MGAMDKAAIILSMFQKSRKRAFELLYDTYYESLVLYSNMFLSNSEAAEDIVHDFFVDFWINNQFNSLPTNLESYIFQAVKYKSLNYIRESKRRQNRHQIVSQENSVNILPEINENNELMDALYRELNSLPKERQKIFLMICIDGFSYQETADQLGISKNTVKTQMSRAVKSLRESLKNNYLSSLLFFILKK